MKYRKKPVVIEAFQWFGSPEQSEDPEWICDAINYGEAYFLNDGTHEFYIKTLEGDLRVTPGDFIIKGVKGEIYPCKPDIFEMTYEKYYAGPKPVDHTSVITKEIGMNDKEKYFFFEAIDLQELIKKDCPQHAVQIGSFLCDLLQVAFPCKPPHIIDYIGIEPGEKK